MNAARTLPYRADLDGLRAIAVLMVVLYHAFPAVGGGGFIGVDIFFVLSGFLITSLIRRQRALDLFTLRHFYYSRARRLFPALAVVLFACLAFGWFFLILGEYRQLGLHAAAGSLFLNNLQVLRESRDFAKAFELKPLMHLWTLAVEEQFYLFWPLWIWLVARTKRPLALTLLLTALSFLLHVLLVSRYPSMSYLLPMTRLWELSAGGALAFYDPPGEIAHAKPKAVAGLLLFLLAGLYAKGPAAAYAPFLLLLPVAGTLLILHAGPGSWASKKGLNHPVLGVVGRMSYALYLWHWPVLIFSTMLMLGPSPFTGKLALVFLSLGLAAATHYGVELPLRRLTAERQRTAVALSTLAMVLLGVFGFAVGTGNILSPLQQESTIIRRKVPLEIDEPCQLSESDGSLFTARGCTQVAKPNRPVVMVVGDASAAFLSVGMRPLVESENINFLLLSVPGCTTFPYRAAWKDCSSSDRYIESKIHEIKPDVLIVALDHAFYTRTLHDFSDLRYEIKLAEKLREYRASTKELLVVGQMPVWKDQLPRLLYRHYYRKRRPFPERLANAIAPASLQWDGLLRKQGLPMDTTFFSLRDLFCNQDGCLTHLGTTSPLVRDRLHLNATAATFVARQMLNPIARKWKELP